MIDNTTHTNNFVDSARWSATAGTRHSAQLFRVTATSLKQPLLDERLFCSVVGHSGAKAELTRTGINRSLGPATANSTEGQQYEVQRSLDSSKPSVALRGLLLSDLNLRCRPIAAVRLPAGTARSTVERTLCLAQHLRQA